MLSSQDRGTEGAERDREADDLLERLTIDEKIVLLSGSDNWHTAGVERVGIGRVKVTDGPNGARGDSMASGTPAVCLPAAVSLAATFDPALVEELGRLLGRETRRKASQLLLAPTINIARHPIGGRNFECFGEDPFLTSALGVAYVEGVQSQGVGACAKHFVANDVEYRRMTASSEVDERTLREVYLAPFEAVVEAGVWSLMAAYPKLNGTFCTEDRWLLSELLRDEWGFDGVVVSDWGATHHRSIPVAAGLDLEMPGPARALGQWLRRAFDEREIDEATIDARVRNVIGLAIRSGRIGTTDEAAEEFVDLPEERLLVRRAAADGIVLARNAGLLPLDPSATHTLAVIGPNADPGVVLGGGSAQVRANHVVSPLEGLRAAFADSEVVHAVGCLTHRYLPAVPRTRWAGNDGLVVETFDGPEPIGDAVVTSTSRSVMSVLGDLRRDVPDPGSWSQRWTGRLAIERSGPHRFGVMAVGRSRVLVDGVVVCDNWTDPQPGDTFFQMGSTEVVGTVELEAGNEIDVVVEWSPRLDELLVGLRFGVLEPVDEDELFTAAVEAARAADAAVVVVGLNADWETESHDRPMFGFPGRQDDLVRAVQAVNPRTVVVVNTGGPVDLPWLDDVAATVLAWYPGQEFGGALADVLTGEADPGGRTPVTFPKRLSDAPTALDVPGDGEQIHYREGLFVGHRWYDARDIEPRLAFGEGLSYTQFTMGVPVVRGETETGGVRIAVEVTNIGSRPGKAVVQGYLEAPAGPLTRPLRTLCGFAVSRLEPGAGEEVEMVVPARSFQAWSAESGWHTPAGTYAVRLGWSSRNLVGSVRVDR